MPWHSPNPGSQIPERPRAGYVSDHITYDSPLPDIAYYRAVYAQLITHMGLLLSIADFCEGFWKGASLRVASKGLWRVLPWQLLFLPRFSFGIWAH